MDKHSYISKGYFTPDEAALAAKRDVFNAKLNPIYRINGNIIFRVNDDGSMTRCAIMDMNDDDIRPYDNETWYSELEEDNEDYEEMEGNYNKLLNLISDTNKKIAAVKLNVSSFVSKLYYGKVKRIREFKHKRAVIASLIVLFTIISIGVIIADFFSEIVPPALSVGIIVFHILIILLCAISFTLVGIAYSKICKQFDMVDTIKNSSEQLSLIHVKEDGVYDFPVDIDLSSIPFIITDVKIGNTYANGNVETPYGNKILSSNSMYLSPRIKIFGINSGTYSLRVRLIEPDGSICKGKTSIGDFTYIIACNSTSGKSDEVNISGWGSSIRGQWRAGQYFVEIWYENTRLIRKPFTVY